MADDFKILLSGTLDKTGTRNNLNSDIEKIKGQIKHIELNVRLSKSSINSIKQQISSLNNQNVNLNINPTSKNNFKKQGQQAGKQFASGMNKAINSGESLQFKGIFDKQFKNVQEAERYFKDTLKEHYKEVSSDLFVDSSASLDRFMIKAKDANGVIDTFRFKLKDIAGEEGKVEKIFEYQGGNINDSGIMKQFKAIEKFALSAEKKLSTLKSDYMNINASRPIRNQNSLTNLDNQYKTVETAISNLRNADESTMVQMQGNVDKEIAKLNQLIKTLRDAENTATSLRSKSVFDVKIDEGNKLDAFVEKMKQSGHYTDELKNDVASLKTVLSTVADSNGLQSYLSQFDHLESKFKSIDASVRTLEKSTNLSTNIDTELTKLANLESELRDVGILTGDLDDNFQKLRSSLGEVGTKSGLTTWRSELKAFESDAKEAIRQQKLLETSLNDTFSLKLDKANLSNRIEVFLRENTKLSKETREELLRLQKQIQDVDSQGLKNLNKEFRNITTSAKAAGQTGDTVFARLKKNSYQFLNYLGSATLIMTSINGVRDIISNVKELDSSMVDLRKVTNETEVTYDRFLTNTAQKAKGLGSSMTDLISSTANFARLGYNLQDASTLAEVATLYKNVGDGINIDEATESIISTLKAFNIEASDSISIVDKFNQVGNNFAISSAGIGEALKRSASAMASANNSLDESIALITAGNNVIQNPESVGVALKTLSLRLRATSAEIEEMGEDSEGAVETVSKLRDLLLSLTKQKVDIQLDDDTYKSTYQIMQDMSKVWSELTDKEQASALEAMFGKRQANIGASILQNMTDAEKALQSSIESSGSAMREQEAYMQGIQYSTDRLTASLQEMAHVTLDSSMIKFFVDLMNGIVNTTTAVGGLIPVLTTLSILYFAFTKNEKHQGLQNLISLLFKTQKVAGATKIAIGGLTMSVQSFTAVLTGGLAIVLPLIIQGFTKLAKSSEEAIQASKDLKDSYSSTTDAIKSNIETVKSLESEFATLSKGVSKYGDNVSLSADEYNRYQDIVNKIVEISPFIVEGYTAEGKAIADKNSLIERSIELLEEERRVRLLDQTTDENNWTVAKGDIEAYKKYVKQAESSQADIIKSLTGALKGKNYIEKDGEYVDELSDEMYDSFITAFNLTEEKVNKAVEASLKGSNISIDSLPNTIKLTMALQNDEVAQDKVIKSLKDDFSLIHDFVNNDGIADINREFSEYANNMQKAEESTKAFNSQLQLVAESNPIYDNLTNAQKDFVTQFVSGFRLAGNETNEQIESITNDIYGFVTKLSENNVAQVRMGELFDLKLNSEDLPLDEYIKQYREIVEQIIRALDGEDGLGLTEEAELNIRTRLNLQIANESEVQRQIYQQIYDLGLHTNVDFDFMAGLNLEDMKVFYEILSAPNSEYDSFDDFKKAFIDTKATTENEPITATFDFTEISKSLEKIEKLQSNLGDISKEVEENGNIGLDSITKLISAYPELNEVLHGYINGLYTEQDVIRALSDTYEQDVKSYQNAITSKYDTDKEFYNKLYSNNAMAINEFAKNYGFDIKNWHSLADAKLDIDNKLIRELSKGWASYFKIVKDATGTYYASMNKDIYEMEIDPKKRQAQLRQLQKVEKKAQSIASQANIAIGKLNNLAGLNLSLPSAKNIINDSINASKGKSGGGGDSSAEDTTDYYLKSFEALLDELQYQRDMDTISEEQYYKALQSLNNEYFKNKSEYLDEYRQYEVEVYQGLKKLEEQRLSDLAKKYDNQLSDIISTQDNIQDTIDLLETSGEKASADLYNSLISNASKQIDILKAEKNAVQALMNEQLSSGFIKSGTDEYYEFINSIRDIDSEINDVIHSVEEWANAIRELSENAFEDLVDNLDHVNSELDTFIGLLSSRELADVNGFTNEGITAIGLYAQQLELAQFKVKQYADAISQLNSDYANGVYSQSEYEERLEDLTQAQWSEVQAIQSAKDGIIQLNQERVNAIKDGLEKEYDAYAKIIQAKKDALSAEENLHNYKKSIADKEKNISDIQRQLATLSANDSMEARTRTALLQEELAKAQSELEEEQYQHSTETQQNALDKELENYRTQIDGKISILDEYLTNENKVIADSLEEAKQQASTVANTIAEIASEHGITVSDSVVSPWLQGSNAIASYGDALSGVTSGFTSQLTSIANEIDKVIAKANQMANSITDGAKKPPTTTTPTTPTTPSKNTDTTPQNSSGDLPISKVKYQGNKSKLQKDVSIVDRLKYNDLDSSAGARAELYEHFGGSGEYTLSAQQNQWLIKKLKENGFKKGGLIGDLIGEDGAILANKGEYVLTSDKFDVLKDTVPLWTQLSKQLQKIDKMPNIPTKSQQPVIQNHFDSLIRVDGNIDKDFSKEFVRVSEQVYNKVFDDLYKGAQYNL